MCPLCGSPDDKQKKQHTHTKKKLERLRGFRLQQIACGSRQTTVLTEAGHIYAWGWLLHQDELGGGVNFAALPPGRCGAERRRFGDVGGWLAGGLVGWLRWLLGWYGCGAVGAVVDWWVGCVGSSVGMAVGGGGCQGIPASAAAAEGFGWRGGSCCSWLASFVAVALSRVP